MKKIVIRVDSSRIIGSGHLMRCLTLAQQLQKNENARVYFISRDLEGNLNDLIINSGFALKILPRYSENFSLTGYAEWLTVPQYVDAAETKKILDSLGVVDMIVVDSYAIDINWENEIRPFVKKIFVIDDLANRKHDCDVLLNQNFHLDINAVRNIYLKLVPAKCELRIGIKYTLLRTEFHEVKKNLRKRDGTIKNILVFYGGSDLTNETMKAISALVKLEIPDLIVNVVVGGSNANRDTIEKFCRKHECLNFHYQVENMAELMNEADLSLGAAGSTTLERFFLGLPSIVTAIAENQELGIQQLEDQGYIVYIGKSKDCSEDDILQAIKSLRKENLLQMQEKCLSIWN